MFSTLSQLLPALVSAIDGLLIMRQSSSPAFDLITPCQIERCKCAHSTFPSRTELQNWWYKESWWWIIWKILDWHALGRGKYVLYYCQGVIIRIFPMGTAFTQSLLNIIFVWSSYFHLKLKRYWYLRFPKDKYSHFTVCKHLWNSMICWCSLCGRN